MRRRGTGCTGYETIGANSKFRTGSVRDATKPSVQVYWVGPVEERLSLQKGYYVLMGGGQTIVPTYDGYRPIVN